MLLHDPNVPWSKATRLILTWNHVISSSCVSGVSEAMKLDDYDAVGARQKQMAGSGTSVKDGKPNRLESATVMEYLRSHGYAKALGA